MAENSGDTPIQDPDDFVESAIKAAGTISQSGEHITFQRFGIPDEGAAYVAAQMVRAQFHEFGPKGFAPVPLTALLAKMFLIGVVYARQDLADEN